ncbi:VOC family protein [Motilimonas pumila]|uniref:Glyoxalase n=1 Tax=Motilimonas pumila TaxID=2303987 RepID=A0A418YF03_9GAMM|nr:VOC family protein [Motilimonas pumila]RJG47769.1 glyoxalase [Motilimonas pumila]
MNNLTTKEIKTFIPAKNFTESKQFYLNMGFVMASDSDGIAYFHHDNSSFLLQDFYDKAHAENMMMHLLVEDAHAWHRHIRQTGIVETFKVKISDVIEQPWGMLDFVISDPSGVLWRIGQNIEPSSL